MICEPGGERAGAGRWVGHGRRDGWVGQAGGWVPCLGQLDAPKFYRKLWEVGIRPGEIL